MKSLLCLNLVVSLATSAIAITGASTKRYVMTRIVGPSLNTSNQIQSGVTAQDAGDRQGVGYGVVRKFRIATKYAALIRRFCQSHGINSFRIIDSQGATEAAPGLGYADIIADITETGTTLRDNQLKIVGGPILKSQACIIASRRVLRQSPEAMATIQTILEMVEARRRARAVVQITANIAGTSVADVGQRIVARPEFAGAQGPTIAPVWPRENGVDGIYMVTMVIPQEQVLATVRHLRALGGDAIAVMPAHYYFTAQSETFARIVQELA